MDCDYSSWLWVCGYVKRLEYNSLVDVCLDLLINEFIVTGCDQLGGRDGDLKISWNSPREVTSLGSSHYLVEIRLSCLVSWMKLMALGTWCYGHVHTIIWLSR